MFLNLLHLIFGLLWAQQPAEYGKKSYTLEKRNHIGDSYHYHYGFKDHLGAFREFKWKVKQLDADSFMFGFGLSEKLGDSFQVGKSELDYSMMKNVKGKLYFDYDKIVEESKPLIEPLYREFKKIIDKYGLNQREKVELVMRFLQDIPYGIPPTNYKNKYIAGLFPPIETLGNTWGDCDSKSLLMATLLSFDSYFYNKMAIILVPGHALLGLKVVPGPYDKFTSYGGENYVYAEPVGLSRTPLGVTNSPYSNSISVIPLNLFEPKVLGPVAPNDLIKNPLSEKDACPDNGLSVEYELPFSNEITKSCQVKVDGVYLKHGPTKFFSKDGKLLREELYDKGERI